MKNLFILLSILTTFIANAQMPRTTGVQADLTNFFVMFPAPGGTNPFIWWEQDPNFVAAVRAVQTSAGTINSNTFSGLLNIGQIDGAIGGGANSNTFTGLLNYGQIDGVPNFLINVTSNNLSGAINYGQLYGVPPFLQSVGSNDITGQINAGQIYGAIGGSGGQPPSDNLTNWSNIATLTTNMVNTNIVWAFNGANGYNSEFTNAFTGLICYQSVGGVTVASLVYTNGLWEFVNLAFPNAPFATSASLITNNWPGVGAMITLYAGQMLSSNLWPSVDLAGAATAAIAAAPFQPTNNNLTALSTNNAVNLTNIPAAQLTGTIGLAQFPNGGWTRTLIGPGGISSVTSSGVRYGPLVGELSTAASGTQILNMPLPTNGYLSNLTVLVSIIQPVTTNVTVALQTTNGPFGSSISPVPIDCGMTCVLQGGYWFTNSGTQSYNLNTPSATNYNCGVVRFQFSSVPISATAVSWFVEWWHPINQ